MKSGAFSVAAALAIPSVFLSISSNDEERDRSMHFMWLSIYAWPLLSEFYEWHGRFLRLAKCMSLVIIRPYACQTEPHHNIPSILTSTKQLRGE